MRFSLLIWATPALAFWRMECRGVVGDYRIDPLMSPGDAAQHLHAILGSGGFSASASNEDIMASDCTSCLVTQDKSSYWHPALYFHDTDTDTYELVGQDGGTLAYYLLNSNGDKISSFPAGFRMIAGEATRRTYTAGNFLMADPPKSLWGILNQTTQDALAQRALGFNCLDYSKSPEGSLQRHFLPDKAFLDANCPDGIRFELMFPQCWDGTSVDSDNHKDHVAYPSLVMEGDCPDTHPKRTPGLFYETIWSTSAFSSRNGEFVISNGDRQGFSYHGDFMMGWDETLLQSAVDQCTNESGLISDCPVFDIQSLSDAQSCKMEAPSVVASDNVGSDSSSPASTLPGGLSLFGDATDGTMQLIYNPLQDTIIPVTNTGGAAATTAAAVTTPSSVPAATTSSSAVATPSSAAVSSEADGIFFQAAANVNSATFSSSAPATTSSTVPTVPSSSSAVTSTLVSSTTVPATTTVTSYTSTAPPSQTNTRVFSTQYVTSGGVVNEILWEQTTEYVTVEPSTEWTTTTVTADANAVRRRQHGHMRRHQRKNL
ncbi:wsc domain-containing protein [Ophiostoma piceae UAMH 11346]|uniref:Wsc domain-containing protein n=1 Tax=Ophiostoma piceae (strain UAMH 11346) TaxID=1262450 RepID=S3CB61_OPHP1|nr:wsc domain-containing protein [Ophiostoma piceae UAMH 11346]